MANDPGQPSPIPYAAMAFHAALAAVVFFALNRFVLEQTLQASLIFGALAAPFAAYLAYAQSRR